MESTNKQAQKRKPGRPRKYPPKPPKPKLTKEELSKVRRAAWERGQKIREETGRLGGRPKGTKGEGYHRSDNIAAGEPRETMTVLKSSADVFRKLANDKKMPIIAAVKNVTDALVRQNPNVFAPSTKKVEM